MNPNKKVKILVAMYMILSLIFTSLMCYASIDTPTKTRRKVIFEYYATVKRLNIIHSDKNNVDELTEINIDDVLFPGANEDGTYDVYEEKIYTDEEITFMYYDDEISFDSVNKNFSKTYDEGHYKIGYLIVNGERIEQTDEQPNPIIKLSKEGVDRIEIHYVENQEEILSNVKFFDYNVTEEGQDIKEKPNEDNTGTKIEVIHELNTYRNGINSLSLTDTKENRIGVGIRSDGQEGIRHNYKSIADVHSVTQGIVDKNLEDGVLKFNAVDPGLFKEEDIIIDGKIAMKYIDDYQLGFSRKGNTYTLSKVYDNNQVPVLSDLDKLQFIAWNWNKTTKLYSNLFWPLDQYPNYEGRDPNLGGNYKFSKNDEDGQNPGVTHNWMFGMYYDMEFTIGDYIGPMNYYFRGDDDFWLFIDGELVDEVDLGGIHAAAGAYVDLRAWMEERNLLEDKEQKHQLSIYFMERGGCGSCCYMHFTIPVNNKISNTEGSYTVNKIWDDNQNPNRPEEISVVLINADSKEVLDTAILTRDDAISESVWKHVFTNVPIYNLNGEKITYRIIEESNLKDYIVGYDVISESETEITNTYSEPMDITVKKIWENDSESDRPESITIILKSNGKELARADLKDVPTEDNTDEIEYGPWSVTFKNLDSINLNGNEIDYNVEELKNRNYISTVKRQNGLNYIITNSLRARPDNNYKEIIVKKTWEDGNDYYGKRPEEVKIKLKEKKTDKIVWEGEISESYREISLNSSEDMEIMEGFFLTATPSNAVKLATPTNAENVVYNLNSELDQYIKEDIGETIISKQKVEKHVPIRKDAEETWTIKLINVPIYNEDGNEIEYEIVEEEISEDYREEYLNYENRYFEIKNTLVKDIAGEKSWEDGGKGMNRPEYITVVLFSGNDLIKKIQVSEREDWKYEFKDLPVFSEDETEIFYVVREFPVSGYEASYDGYNICNTYIGHDAILPETGGKGIYLYWILGIALIIGLCYEPGKLKKKRQE